MFYEAPLMIIVVMKNGALLLRSVSRKTD